jgi:SAM-dependent methyltransferase
MAFKDHFSSQSAAYRRYRPEYPPALIGYVASLARDRRLAIDCATGNGQAAVALAEHFAAVLAVDGSLSQLVRAQSRARVHYAAGLAEQLPLRDRCAGLVAAAQAAHWFDFDRFHAECRRVLVPGGVVAVWTYEKFRVDPGVDAVIDQFYSGVVGPYWPPERRLVEQGYRTLPFPWCETSAARTRCLRSSPGLRQCGLAAGVAGCAGRFTCASAGPDCSILRGARPAHGTRRHKETSPCRF